MTVSTMGLSSNSLPDTKFRFALAYYSDPTFHEWKEWFSWYPVKVVYFYNVDSHYGNVLIKSYRWSWLKNVVRRRVIDRLDGPGREGVIPTSVKYYEYTTMLELLANG